LHPHEFHNQRKPGATPNKPLEAKRSSQRHRHGTSDNGASGCEDESDAGRKSAPDVDPVAYTMGVFCALLSISESFGWKMLKDGRLNCIRIGRRTLIPHSELQRLTKAAA
jgi:excisionase family DNA binding protein